MLKIVAIVSMLSLKPFIVITTLLQTIIDRGDHLLNQYFPTSDGRKMNVLLTKLFILFRTAFCAFCLKIFFP